MSTIDRMTVLFTKVDGVQQLAREVGEAAARDRVLETQDRLTALVEGCDGERVDAVGNDLLCVFASPDAALEAAVQMQSDFHRASPLAAEDCAQRVGMHWGVTYRREREIFGDTVNTASRVVNLAKPRQILLTEQTMAQMHAQARDLLRPYDRVRVKGKKDELVIFEGVWQPEDMDLTKVVTQIIDTGFLKNLSASKLRLQFEGKAIELNPGMVPVTVGRGRHCEIMVTSPSASRNHCKIDHRRGKFVLIDESTNGTHLLRDDGSDAVLRREEAVLTGSGCFCMGEQGTPEHPYRVAYHCS